MKDRQNPSTHRIRDKITSIFYAIATTLIILTTGRSWSMYTLAQRIMFPEAYELWQPHTWPVTTTNHLPSHMANYLGYQMVFVFV